LRLLFQASLYMGRHIPIPDQYAMSLCDQDRFAAGTAAKYVEKPVRRSYRAYPAGLRPANALE